MDSDDRLTSLQTVAGSHTEIQMYQARERVFCKAVGELNQRWGYPNHDPLLCLMLNPDGIILCIESFNSSWFTLDQDRIGASVFNLVCPDDRGTLQQALTTVATQPTWQISQPIRCMNSQGHAVAVQVTVAQFEDKVRLVAEPINRAIADTSPSEMEAHLHLLDAAIHHATEGISYINLQGTYITANSAYAALFGYLPDELTRLHWHDTVHPDDRPILETAYQQMLTSGKAVVEVKGVRQDCSCFDQQLVLVAVYNSQQQPVGHYCLSQDISIIKQNEAKHHQIEKALSHSEAKFRHLYDNSPVMMHSINEQGIICDINRRWLEETGYTRDEVIGQPVDFCMTPASAERARADVIPRFWRDGYVRDVPYQYICKDGRIIDVLLNCDATIAPSGQWVSLSVVRNVTEHNQIEAELRNSEARYRAIVEDQTELICRFLADGTLTFVNEAYCHYFSKRAEDLVGCSFMLTVLDVDRQMVEQQIASLTIDHPITTCEHRAILSNGNIRWQQWTNRAIFDEGEFVEFQAVGRDITALKQTETALKLVNETLEIKVQERTGALNRAIKRLQNEVTERRRIELSLREQEEFLRSIYNGVEEAIFVVDIVAPQDFRYTGSNAAHERLTGLMSHDLIGTRPEQIFPPAIAAAVCQRYNECIQAGSSIMYEECLPFGSSETWWFTTLNPLRDRENRITRLIGTSTNITERKQAEKALQQRVERERLISDITQRIRQSLDLEAVLNTTVAEVRQFLRADRTLILRLEPDSSSTVIVESVATEWTSLLGLQIRDLYVAETASEVHPFGHVHAIHDIFQTALPVYHIDFLQRLQVRAALVVPILQADTLWGLLITHQCSAPKYWQPVEIELLQQLAAQVGIAIQQSELYQRIQQFNSLLEAQVQERTQQLEQALAFEAVLQRVTDKVRDSLDENLIVQTAVQELTDILQVRYCNAAYHASDLSAIQIIHEASTVPFKSQVPILPIPEFPQVYQQIHQGDCVQFCTTVGTLNSEQFMILVCPIADDHGVLRDLLLLDKRDRAFSALEVHLVQQVAAQCAIAIRQARLYQAVQTQVQELERLNHLKDDFLSTVSHELRSPVANMKMALQMLELSLRQSHLSDSALATIVLHPENHSPKEHSQDDQAQKNKINLYLQILGNECKREADLINDLLDLQRLEAGKQSLSLTEIPLQTWLPQILEPFVERAKSRQQRLLMDVPAGLPAILSDAAALERILVELLTNACKYTPPGEQIALSIALHPAEILLKVVNFGVEIPANELPLIFDKFYRVPNIDAWKQGGTGLGLALIQRLTEHLGGRIHVESAAGYTCFTVQVPLINDRQTNLFN